MNTSGLGCYQIHSHIGHVPIPESISSTRGMDSSDWLRLSHVLKSALLKLFGLNGRMWFCKGKSRYSYWKKSLKWRKGCWLGKNSCWQALSNLISPIETLLTLKGLSQEFPFEVIPNPLTTYDFSLFCVSLASCASFCCLFSWTLYDHHKFIFYVIIVSLLWGQRLYLPCLWIFSSTQLVSDP